MTMTDAKEVVLKNDAGRPVFVCIHHTGEQFVEVYKAGSDVGEAIPLSEFEQMIKTFYS